MAAGVPVEIPTLPRSQRFAISLNEVLYNVRIVWNAPSRCWIMDILDQEHNPILSGVPLVTGANLLEQFNYLELGGQMLVQSDDNVDAVPTFANLGTIGHLYYVPS